MYAWQIAKEKWERDNPGKSFENLLGGYIKEGCYVWSAPTEFCLAAPVRIDEDGRIFHDPDNGDTWFVHLAARTDLGNLRAGEALLPFIERAPYMLPFVAWHRRNGRLHRWAWEDFLRHLNPLLHEYQNRLAPTP